MREIKFKAWNKTRKEMYDVYGFNADFVFKDTLDGVGCDGVLDNIDDVILLQFTGLYDKNGVEIYEGDEVQFNFYKKEGEIKHLLRAHGFVQYCTQSAMYLILTTYFDRTPAEPCYSLSSVFNIEVVGKKDAIPGISFYTNKNGEKIY